LHLLLVELDKISCVYHAMSNLLAISTDAIQATEVIVTEIM
jgi:hypothetical protein